MPLTPGSRLGAYDILSPLGKGGMGEVWRARDPRLGREVAIKVLPADVAAHPDRLARFEREARAVAALNHPNLVTLHSIEEADGVRFLTMEVVEGETLDRVVVHGGLATGRVLDLAIPIADALAAAHQKGVVHRDLKPANVMVSREGRVKVLDFGLAKLGDADPFGGPAGATQAPTMESPISAIGLVVGTVPYMAPEQLRGEPADARTDLFALGVVLYELATGKRPFGGATSVEVSSAILRDVPPPPSSLRGDVPKDLERIISRCLEKDPERRVQTAKDVRNELELVRRAVAPPAAAPAPPVAARMASAVAAPAHDATSIAVLPFANRSADPADEYFSDGLADELLSVLVKIRGLRVAARTSSATFKGKDVTIAEVGKALHVATVLEGSVRKAGNRVRISVQLVKVEDGYPLWSETYDRTLEDIFAVQDDIAQSVVKELRTTLLGEAPDSNASGEAKAEVAAAAVGRGENAEAHRLYLQGAYFLERFTQGDTASAIRYFEQALALDASHALAWAELARALSLQAAYGWVGVDDGYARARAAAQRSLALAPNLVETHLVLAQIQVYYDWDWKSGERSTLRALEIAPGSPVALAAAGTLAEYLGRYEEAERHFRHALELDPISSRSHSMLGLVLRAMDRLAEAEVAVRKAIELAPSRITAHHHLAMLCAETGRDAEAIAEAQLEPAPWARLTALAYAHELAGRRKESDAALDLLVRDHAVSSAFQISVIYGLRGDADHAFEWIDRGIAQRDSGMVIARCERSLRSLHGDPRWPVALRKLGFEV
jgi:TolB-like protein/Tfp pilus assembly protein PilF